jgi:tetratricopeptide (TPR) repeat protein
MAKKKRTGKSIHNNSTATKPPAVKKGEKHIHQHTNGTGQSTASTPKWMVPVILIVTFLAYIPVLNAGFVEWDDPDYVSNNILIRSFSNLGKLLITPLQGNYHPLTMLSLAINYAISGLDAWSYHLFNLIFHLVNCYLTFRLTMLLTNRNLIIAFTTAILFGVHPMHVESVAWISERKDVLYTLFFLAGLISYIKYVDDKSKKHYIITLLYLVLSLLSKHAAVVFPVVMFIIDIFRKRQLNIKLVVEKIPFFVIAFITGLITYLAQTNVGATGFAGEFSLTSRIFMGFYGIMMYFIKMLLPFNLSPFYPFPAIKLPLPTEYFISPIFTVVLILLIYFTWKKTRVIVFGVLFYITNLLLVLQFLPVGSAIIADRYTYIPYIGLFFIIGWLISRYAKENIYKANYIVFPITLFLAVRTFTQSKIWHDTAALWDHAIKVKPSARAYGNRGWIYNTEKNYPMAMQYYNEALKINAIDYEAYRNRGNLYFNDKKYNLAYSDYMAALKIKSDDYAARVNLGALYSTLGKYDSALMNFDHALRIKPDYKSAFQNRGLTYMVLTRFDEAIRDFKKFLELAPEDADVHNIIGYCLRMQQKYSEAISLINKAIELRPKGEFFLNRAYSYYGLNNLTAARQDAQMAKQNGVVLEAEIATILGIQ